MNTTLSIIIHERQNPHLFNRLAKAFDIDVNVLRLTEDEYFTWIITEEGVSLAGSHRNNRIEVDFVYAAHIYLNEELLVAEIVGKNGSNKLHFKLEVIDGLY